MKIEIEFELDDTGVERSRAESSRVTQEVAALLSVGLTSGPVLNMLGEPIGAWRAVVGRPISGREAEGEPEDPFEELARVPGHDTRSEPEGESFRAKCSCGWQCPATHDNEYSCDYAGWAHKQLQRQSVARPGADANRPRDDLTPGDGPPDARLRP